MPSSDVGTTSQEKPQFVNFRLRDFLRLLLPKPIDTAQKPWTTIKDPHIREAVENLAKERRAYEEGFNKCADELAEKLQALLDSEVAGWISAKSDERITPASLDDILTVAEKALERGYYESEEHKEGVKEWVERCKAHLISELLSRGQQAQSIKEGSIKEGKDKEGK